MVQEWLWALAICAVPFLAFGALEVTGIVRRRRLEVVARRSKDIGAGRR